MDLMALIDGPFALFKRNQPKNSHLNCEHPHTLTVDHNTINRRQRLKDIQKFNHNNLITASA